jgi:DNA-binding transcriptional LysR family regulator
MRDVHLPAVDLNLLPALEALLKRRNVSAAARDVGLSQPAMSRALARLRDVLGDTLLVRAPGGGYALTPRAQALAEQLVATLDHVKAVFREPSFDPAHVQRTIRIAGIDTHTILLAPPLMARLAKEAPGIDIRIENYSADIIARMQTGQLDLAFAQSITPLPPGTRSASYARDKLALVLRKDHPMAKRKWTAGEGRREAAHGAGDAALHRSAGRRRSDRHGDNREPCLCQQVCQGVRAGAEGAAAAQP